MAERSEGAAGFVGGSKDLSMVQSKRFRVGKGATLERVMEWKQPELSVLAGFRSFHGEL